MLKRLLAEAIRLRMEDLRADIEWLICPQPDAEALAALDQGAAALAQLAELPGLRDFALFDYLREAARQKNHGVADEIRDLLRSLARAPEFASYMRDGTIMPSLRGAPRPLDAPPPIDNPSLVTTLGKFVADWLRFYLPRAMIAAALHRPLIIPNLQTTKPTKRPTIPRTIRRRAILITMWTGYSFTRPWGRRWVGVGCSRGGECGACSAGKSLGLWSACSGADRRTQAPRRRARSTGAGDSGEPIAGGPRRGASDRRGNWRDAAGA